MTPAQTYAPRASPTSHAGPAASEAGDFQPNGLDPSLSPPGTARHVKISCSVDNSRATYLPEAGMFLKPLDNVVSDYQLCDAYKPAVFSAEGKRESLFSGDGDAFPGHLVEEVVQNAYRDRYRRDDQGLRSIADADPSILDRLAKALDERRAEREGCDEE